MLAGWRAGAGVGLFQAGLVQAVQAVELVQVVQVVLGWVQVVPRLALAPLSWRRFGNEVRQVVSWC